MPLVKVIDLDVKEMRTNSDIVTRRVLDAIPSIVLDDNGDVLPLETTANEVYYKVRTVYDYSGNYTLFAIKQADYEMFDSLLKLSNERIQKFGVERYMKGFEEGAYKAEKILRELNEMTFWQRVKYLFTN